MSEVTFSARLLTLLRAPGTWVKKMDPQGAGLSALAASLRSIDKRAASKPFEPFDDFEMRVAGAVAARMCRPDGDDLPEPDPDRMARFIESYVLKLPVEQATKLRDLLVAFEYQPFVFGPGRTRFTALSPEDQDENLAKWARSTQPQRQAVFQALKQVCMLAYWTQDETWGAIGYGGPLVEPGYMGGEEGWGGEKL